MATSALFEIPDAAKKLARDYDGHIFISDIDKTYLATQIDSLAGLLKAAFETAERKSNVPGFSIILRAIRRGGTETPTKNPLFFLSASPPQMRVKLEAKMEIDGVEYNGIIFKNQMVHVRRAHFKKLKEQLGFKLEALLRLWGELPQASKLVLFGDDSESDAVVYSLFSEILAQNIGTKDLFELLTYLGVFREEALKIAWYSRRFKKALYPVDAVFINLETGSQPGYYRRFGPNLLPTDNSFQTAIALYERNLIREKAVFSIAKVLYLQYDFSQETLLKSAEAGARRGLYGLDTFDKLWPALSVAGYLPERTLRIANEGALTRLPNPGYRPPRRTLNEMKKNYSDEGRY